MTSAEVDALLAIPGNHTCADCAAGAMARAGSGRKQRPLWASVNLGVVLSVQAAGVHRKLGIGVSKVLSLTMDEWTTSDYRGMLSRGNDAVNAELEALPHFPEIQKPSMLGFHDLAAGKGDDGGEVSKKHGGMLALEAYVHAKYVAKSFVVGGDGAVEALEALGGDLEKYIGASVEYSGVLHVRVVSATDLPSMDVCALSDPYAVVRLPPGQERRTKTVRNSNDPKWGESLMFNTGDLGTQTLEMWVWDEDVVHADDLIGVATFPLSALMDSGGGGGWRMGTGTSVHLSLEKADARKGFMSRVFSCCAAPPRHLGSITIELNFIALNNE